ncbi:MAG: cell division protein FtsL [Hungatella sp.]|nr:cell division protein FtsL [Hungatella sp.]
MAEKKTTAKQAYIHGSVVRKIEPERRLSEEKRQKKTHKVSSRVRKNQEKALRMDLPYLVVLLAASCCTLFICISYIQVRSAMTRRMENIKKLEQDIDALKSENDALQTRINTSVDLEYVYQVATEELGMVYAGKDQVRMYHQTESEYVRQYEDIPTY